MTDTIPVFNPRHRQISPAVLLSGLFAINIRISTAIGGRPVSLKIDFKAYGAAIKAGRAKQKESRNKAADALFISPRYLVNIENKGQHPSVQVFLELMSRYHISVDQILHDEAMEGRSTERMQFDTLLDELTDVEIKIHTATAQALMDTRTDSEGEN